MTFLTLMAQSPLPVAPASPGALSEIKAPSRPWGCQERALRTELGRERGCFNDSFQTPRSAALVSTRGEKTHSLVCRCPGPLPWSGPQLFTTYTHLLSWHGGC